MDDVTVVIPTRDRPDLLSRAVRSALEQEGATVEVVVVDDGSATGIEPEVLPAGVRLLVHPRPLGPTAARNTGLAAAHGRWVMFLDDDDTLLPGAVATSLRAARSSALPPPVAVLSAIEAVGDRVEILHPLTLPRGGSFLHALERHEGRLLFANTLFCERGVLEEIGGWDTRLPAAETDDLFLRLAPVTSLQGTPEVTYRMTNEAPRRLHRDVEAMIAGTQRTLAVHAKAFSRCPPLRSRYMVKLAVLQLEHGEWSGSIGSMTRAFAIQPFHRRWMRQMAGALAGPAAYRAIRGGRALGESG